MLCKTRLIQNVFQDLVESARSDANGVRTPLSTIIYYTKFYIPMNVFYVIIRIWSNLCNLSSTLIWPKTILVLIITLLTHIGKANMWVLFYGVQCYSYVIPCRCLCGPKWLFIFSSGKMKYLITIQVNVVMYHIMNYVVLSKWN